MSKEGETTILHAETDLKLVNSDKTKFEIKENFEAWLKLLEALVLIQEKVPVVITLSDKHLTDEKVNHIFEVASIIKKGKIEASVETMTTITTLDEAIKTSKRFAEEKLNLVILSYQDWKTKVLGNEIDLGVAVISFDAFMTEKDFEKLEKAIEVKEKEIEITLTPKDNSAIIDFLRWDCEDRHTRFQITDSLNE